jgi:hypothetical protein
MTWLAALMLMLVQAAQPQIPVQLGVTVTADTVTVGERFIAVVRVRAPRGATIDFPTTSDSATLAAPTATELIGKPVVQAIPDTASTTMSAAYRLAAWDTGLQRLGLADVTVTYNGQTGYVSLKDRGVFVKSVLPADSTLRVPKPPRAAIPVKPFSWLPWLIVLAAIAAAFIAWRIWVWYRNRKNAPLDPFAAAEREFARIEEMRLVESGETERHAALMSDVMRRYLAARVPEIEASHTSSEMLAAGGKIHAQASGLGELLWRTDLVKFAGLRIDASEARRLATESREVVRRVEEYLRLEEDREEERKAA